MKTLVYFALSGIAALFVLIGCKKDDTAKDYRSAFTGKFNVKETTTCYGAMGDCQYEKDTTIYVVPGDSDSIIIVMGRTININPEGSYTAYHYGLQFRNDSIFSFNMTGGLEGGTYIRHEGKRISKKWL
jgi:hypothetical protein